MEFFYEYEGKILGQGTRQPLRRWGRTIAPHNSAFFCVACGRIWARIAAVPGSDDNNRIQWRVSHLPCKRDGGTGSLYLEFEEDRIADLPQGVLIHELEIALENPLWPEPKFL